MPAPSKYGDIWNELDALDLYETWFVSSERLEGPTHNILVAMTRVFGKGKFSMMKLLSGILFVRIKS